MSLDPPPQSLSLPSRLHPLSRLLEDSLNRIAITVRGPRSTLVAPAVTSSYRRRYLSLSCDRGASVSPPSRSAIRSIYGLLRAVKSRRYLSARYLTTPTCRLQISSPERAFRYSARSRVPVEIAEWHREPSARRARVSRRRSLSTIIEQCPYY